MDFEEERDVSHSNSMIFEDRFYGAFMGLILGDALGSPHEFSSVKYTGKMEHQLIAKWRCHENRILPCGSVSDDTEMTLALLKSLTEVETYDQDSVVQSYLNWGNSRCPFMGKNTRYLFNGIKTLKTATARREKMINPENNQSNGSLMRCLPLFLFDNETIEADVNLTNPNPVNREASRTYLTAIYQLMMGRDSLEIFNEIVESLETEPLQEAARQIIENEDRDIETNRGWVAHAWYCAFRSLTQDSDFASNMKWIIKGNPKSDTDTDAAITGALLGARYGRWALLSDPITFQNWQVILEAPSKPTDVPRPLEYSILSLDGYLRRYLDLFT